MGRKLIKTGHLIKIPMSNKLGFAFAKYFDLTKFPNVSYPSLIKVYDYWAKSDIFEIDEIINSDYLIQPILVAGINPIIKSKSWEIIGQININENEFQLPHFKTHEPRWDVEENAINWYYVLDCDSNKRIKTVYEKVKHLESFASMGSGNVELRITMQILRRFGLDIGNWFDLNNETNVYQYKKTLESPLLSKIPYEMHEKAIL